MWGRSQSAFHASAHRLRPMASGKRAGYVPWCPVGVAAAGAVRRPAPRVRGRFAPQPDVWAWVELNGPVVATAVVLAPAVNSGTRCQHDPNLVGADSE
jgi:hypothetical protein